MLFLAMKLILLEVIIFCMNYKVIASNSKSYKLCSELVSLFSYIAT